MGRERGGRVVLVADDYAMTDGISEAIDALAAAGRLSATSVMVTTPYWSRLGGRARALRDRLSVGLHIDMTLDRPLAPMPSLAPGGRFPRIGEITTRAVHGKIDAGEVAAEVNRQIAAFEAAVGALPDHIDGHQHVHALPGVRDGVLDALAAVRWIEKPLVRDPADSLRGILARRTAIAKSLTLSWLSRGFGGAARAKGFPVNDSFAGVTGFAPDRAADDLRRAGSAAGPVHLVMCHPGFPDAELAALDPVTERRRREHDALMVEDLFGGRLWHPQRTSAGAIDWRAAAGSWP